MLVTVDPPLAAFSAWYELFPRSTGPEGKHGTLRDAEARLAYVADLGFDVVYLPPIHPIGRTHRKGRDNALVAQPGEPGSPWAIGGAEGGHKQVHPELGTLEDLRHFVAAARQRGLEVALDVAFQTSPDHPYVREHPDWFVHRADGSVQFAENPPKKYEDIYPFDFAGPAWQGLWNELRSVFLHWIEQGVRLFRVDNPHTKPIPFWAWCIESIKARHPEVIFLAEAFTRPKLMQVLAKVGFSQSYTYFTWRTSKSELTEYVRSLAETDVREYFRPNFWPNTPDILPEHLQYGGRGAFIARAVLAATLSPSWGIYGPPFELMEHVARPGTEEYADNEKYQLRRWDLDDPRSLRPIIKRLNQIRRDNPALHRLDGTTFHRTDNDMLIAYSRRSQDGQNLLLAVVNLDPHHVQSGWMDLDLGALGLAPDTAFQAHDLIGDARYVWRGRAQLRQPGPRVDAGADLPAAPSPAHRAQLRVLPMKARDELAARLIDDARQRRWFRGKSRTVTGARIADRLPLDEVGNVLVVLDVQYAEGDPDLYVVPLDRQDGELAIETAAVALFETARQGVRRRGEHGALSGQSFEAFAQLAPEGAAGLTVRVAGVEQTNSTVIFGDRALLKIYRQLSAGPNPELELGRYLDRACDPPCVPRVLGALTYQPQDGPARSLGIVHELIANRGDAWSLAQRELARFFAGPPSQDAGRFATLAAVLGRRTGELHLALAGRAREVPDSGPDFAPEPLTDSDRRALANRTEAMLNDVLAALARSGKRSPSIDRLLAADGRAAISRALSEFRDQPLEAVKTRTHGDLHLGQVLAVARAGQAPDDAAIDDFVIIDFEGEPARPLSERRAKGSPLRDVMGMVRSFDYAPEAALREAGAADRAGRGRQWTRQVTTAYLGAYFDRVGDAPFIPRDRAQRTRLLTYYELEKVVYEVGYELNNRPDWLDIPLRGLLAAAGLEGGT